MTALKIIAFVVSLFSALIQLLIEVKNRNRKSVLIYRIVFVSLLCISACIGIIATIDDDVQTKKREKEMSTKFDKINSDASQIKNQKDSLIEKMEELNKKFTPLYAMAVQQFPELSPDDALDKLSSFLASQQQKAFISLVETLVKEHYGNDFSWENSGLYEESIQYAFGDINNDQLRDVAILFTLEDPTGQTNNWSQYLGVFVYKNGKYNLLGGDYIGGKYWRSIFDHFIYGKDIILEGFENCEDDPFNFPTLPVRYTCQVLGKNKFNCEREIRYPEFKDTSLTRDKRIELLKSLEIYPYKD